MYQITQTNKVEEDVQFCNCNGDVVLTVPVSFNVDEKAIKFEQAYERIGLAFLEIKKKGNTDDNRFNAAAETLSLFKEIFGEENLVKILDFYKGNYIEMLEDLIVFVEAEIKPKVAAAQKAKKEKLLAVKKAERWRR